MKKVLPKKLSEKEKLNWIKLARTENIGPATFFRLLEIFGSPENALEKLPSLIDEMGHVKKTKIYSDRDLENELSGVKKFGAEILLYVDEAYPRLVREIDDPAPIITIFGRKELLNQDSIGVVGPRNATFHACKFAEKIAQDLGQNNITIISGLAKGVDAAAHRGSISTGTVAVIAGGISNIYPNENLSLYQKIYQEGVVVSETPFGLEPRAFSFIQRNRIISGMSYGVVIVEAGMQSGSLTTARFALEQGREVFAVPGSPLDPRCFGSNTLLEEGAIFTQNAARVMREMQNLRARFSQAGIIAEPDVAEFFDRAIKIPSEKELKELRELIMQKIGFVAIDVEEIIIEIGASTRLLNIALVQLELTDQIIVNAGKISKK